MPNTNSPLLQKPVQGGEVCNSLHNSSTRLVRSEQAGRPEGEQARDDAVDGILESPFPSELLGSLVCQRLHHSYVLQQVLRHAMALLQVRRAVV